MRSRPPRLARYLRPSQRASHSAVWSDTWDMMLAYGGDALEDEQTANIAVTYPEIVSGDLWSWQKNNCPLNCSSHGSCEFGFCFCKPGYFGTDCSNFTCPGSFCSYDEFSHEQECSHCCSGYHNVSKPTWSNAANNV